MNVSIAVIKIHCVPVFLVFNKKGDQMSNNNDMQVVSNNTIVMTDAINNILSNIADNHLLVSNIETPKAYIKKKQGMDYVELGFLKGMADKHFPGWSWEIINSEALGSEAYVVHGRLKWFDAGIWRTGDMVAAHRIQKKKGSDKFVDVGNDVKAANTDTMKKAFNMYLNISDDVYRNQLDDLELSDDQYTEIIEVAVDISAKQGADIDELIKDGTINTTNYKGSLSKLKRIQNEKR